MKHKEHYLVEDIWYTVQLHDENFYSFPYPPVRVEGKFGFIGKLITVLDGKVIFKLQDGKGSVVIPFNFIKWMVPLYKKKEEGNWLNDLQP